MKAIKYFPILTLLVMFCPVLNAQVRPSDLSGERPTAIPRTRLTPEQEAAAEAYLQAHDQYLYQKLVQRKQIQPQSYYQALGRAYGEMIRMEEMQERDPEMYERLKLERQLDQEARSLAREIQEITVAEEIESKQKELQNKLNRLFDLRQENRLDEIKTLEQRIRELKENNAKRLANKETIVQRRLNELLGKRDELDW